MFYNNVNSKKLKCVEELVTAIAIIHNVIRAASEFEAPPEPFEEARVLRDVVGVLA
jgi:hypothetical protein